MSRRRLIDTCRLIRHWRKCKGSRALEDCTNEDAINWARSQIDLEGTDAIVTPVAVEFLCGSRSSHEARLARTFLDQFRTLDEGKITSDDWKEALRLAAWAQRDARPRQLGDVLILAIARRLGYEVLTDDLDNRRRSQTTR